jgi:hypothetical protein
VFQDFDELLRRRYALESAVVQAEYFELQPKTRETDALVTYIAEQRALRAKYLAEKEAEKAAEIDKLIRDAQADLSNLDHDLAFQTRRAQVATARILLSAFDAFTTAMNTVPAGGKYAPLLGAALREQLHGSNPKVTHLLYVEISASGADVVTRTGPFWAKQKTAFLGAVQATYVLASADGAIKASGTVTESGVATFDFDRPFAVPDRA